MSLLAQATAQAVAAGWTASPEDGEQVTVTAPDAARRLMLRGRADALRVEERARTARGGWRSVTQFATRDADQLREHLRTALVRVTNWVTRGFCDPFSATLYLDHSRPLTGRALTSQRLLSVSLIGSLVIHDLVDLSDRGVATLGVEHPGVNPWFLVECYTRESAVFWIVWRPGEYVPLHAPSAAMLARAEPFQLLVGDARPGSSVHFANMSTLDDALLQEGARRWLGS